MSSSAGVDAPATMKDLLTLVDNLHDVEANGHPRLGDARDGRIYVVTPEIVTALKVAVVTGRPLLLSGPPGCGKSSLASYVARNLSLSYFEFTVTDDSDPRDLLWRMD